MAKTFYHWLQHWLVRIAVIFALILLSQAERCFAQDNVANFQTVEYSLEQSLAPPIAGWTQATLPLNPNIFANFQGNPETQIVWLRFSFTREDFVPTPISVSLSATHQLFDVFLNTQLIYSNFSNSENQRTATFQPYLIPLTEAYLKPHSNVFVLRMLNVKGVAQIFDGVAIGENQRIKTYYNWQNFIQFLGPQLANAALIAMTLSASVLWLKRRKEFELACLTALGVFWAADNFHHVILNSSVAPIIAQQFHIIIQTFLALSMVSFAVVYFRTSKNTLLVGIAIFAILTEAIARAVLSLNSAPNVAGFLIAVPAAFAMISLYFAGSTRSPLATNVALPLAIVFAFVCQLHDLASETALWHGIGFELLPYASTLVFATFSFVLGRNILENLSAKEKLTAQLSQRIETTKANLLVSEGARRQLEISNAITHERERMMREIHDGIGSSLVAALASAERQGKQSSTAVVALKGALTDLRIAVDSLEPVEGNVTTLLASLRYRIEPELKKANMEFEWRVDDVPELDWLDAPNALHILRIFQEAFSNIFGHANATRIRVGCKMHLLEGRPGIMIEVADNGKGFDLKIPPKGRGRKNMFDRAEAVGGKLTLLSEPNAGCSTMLWLPLIRARVI